METKVNLSKQWFIDSRKGNIKDSYHFIERLGSGGFGVVYLAQERKSGDKFAVKAIQKNKIQDYDTFQNEIRTLRTLDHPNIIKLYEIWEWQDVCFLVTEQLLLNVNAIVSFCEGGELFYYILQKKSLSEKEAALIMKQGFSALSYIHHNKISHRDIKPENFMLKNKDDITNIKLIDFGLAKDFSEQQAMQTPSGSPYYIAPEVFSSKYNEKCDLWSIGVVLYILLSGKVPFPGESNKEIIENVVKGDYHFNHEAFLSVSALAKDLIKKLLVKDIDQRYSAVEAYNHPWIQKSEEILDNEIAAEAFDNMKNFMQAVNLKKTTLIYLASKLPEKNIDELRKLFIQIDLDGDGIITSEEFKHALTIYGFQIDKDEIEQLVNQIDTNNNGFIDYTEFIAGCMKSKIYLREENIRGAFQYFDQDQSGSITKDELKSILSSEDVMIPDAYIEQIIKEVDVNKDDQIDYNEFLEMMKKDLKVRLAVYNMNLKDLMIFKPQCSIF
ncbi:protein kinase domain containing protein [Stylonychia lemnae]|uniref:non-specific serine/threonine protein kinase n=1 Tax=Stylonychia lemnae TaxID=5949 RepID=A0A078B2N2_STYLE|nr:protein kinase domain containing protein [Stylonychia lemnae]|eukprot:CDW87482.1 protein kinase domain containing protein [Stylonychia lemnae]